MADYDSTAAPPRPCPCCAQPEHGSAACSLPALVDRGMDDIEAGRFRMACKGPATGAGRRQNDSRGLVLLVYELED